MGENPLDGAGEPLEELWLRYKEAVRAGGNPQALYQEMVWPALLERWRREPSVYPTRQAFAVSVHTLGTSPEATALAVLGAGAEQVYVLHTAETARLLPRLREDTGKDLYPIEIGKSDVAAIYREVKRLLERHPDVPMALDLTSGTKAMSAGLAAAGFFFQRFFPQVRVVYVDNEDYDPELRRPRAGTERLVVLPNPQGRLKEPFRLTLWAPLTLLEGLPPPGTGVEVRGVYAPRTRRLVAQEARAVRLWDDPRE
jgi:hypothetical protein